MRSNTRSDPVNLERTWRFPLKGCKREGAAAFVLSQCYLEGFGVERSEQNATHWLFVAANAGVTLAMAACAKVGTRWDIPVQPTDQTSTWASEGSETWIPDGPKRTETGRRTHA